MAKEREKPIESEWFDHTPYTIQGYEISKLIAAGSTAVIKLARHLQTNRYYAVKIFDKKSVVTNPYLSTVKEELEILTKIRHPNIVHTYEVFFHDVKAYIVLEYVSGGELYSKFPRGGIFPEDDARRYFQQLICAVDFCHKRGVYHRNIKPENLLVDRNGFLKVSDFGLGVLGYIPALLVDEPFNSTLGKAQYLAPEVIAKTGHDAPKADIWACGVILYDLVAGRPPFNDRDLKTLFLKAYHGDYIMPEHFSPSLRLLIKRLLDPNTKTRIKMEEIFKDRWFKTNFQAPIIPEGNIAEETQNLPLQQNAAPPVKKNIRFNNVVGNLLKKVIPKTKTTFNSNCTAKEIMSEIEDAAQYFGYKIKERSYKLKLEKEENGRKGDISIITKITESNDSDHPLFRTVEVEKVGGSLGFEKFFDALHPELRNIICKVVYGNQNQSVNQVTDGAGTSTAR